MLDSERDAHAGPTIPQHQRRCRPRQEHEGEEDAEGNWKCYHPVCVMMVDGFKMIVSTY